MKEINKNIARNIGHYMDSIGISQIDLAKLLGCSNTTVSMWIKGNATPRLDKIDKMCKIFACERQDLIRDTPSVQQAVETDKILQMFVNLFQELDPEQRLQLIAYMHQLKETK